MKKEQYKTDIALLSKRNLELQQEIGPLKDRILDYQKAIKEIREYCVDKNIFRILEKYNI